MLEWLMEHIPNAKIFLINFPRNYREESWYITNNAVLNKIALKYNLPVVDMYNKSPFTRENGNIYRPVGYNPNGSTLQEKYGNLHFGKLGYLTFAKYLIKNVGNIIADNMEEYSNEW